MRKFTHYLAAVAASALFVCGTATSAEAVRIGTMQQGTSSYSMGSAIARVLAEAGLEPRVQPAAGSSSYLPLIDMGELDFGIANVIEATQAIGGEGGFKDHQLNKLRVIGVMYPFRVGIFVRDDSGIDSIADLRGKRVTLGYTSQLTINRVVTALLANGGLAESDVEAVMVPTVIRGADAFAAGRADAGFFAIGAGKVSQIDASVGGLRFLPVSDAPEAVAALQRIVPEAYVGTVRPGASMAGVDKTMNGMIYDYLLLAGAHVPDEVVAKVIKALHDNKDQLVASFGGFRGFEPDRMAKELPVKWHDGAKAAYEDLGQWPPKK